VTGVHGDGNFRRLACGVCLVASIALVFVDSPAAGVAVKDENNTETELMKELFGPAADYDARARPQFHAVNVSIYHVLESIIELV